MRFEIVDTQPTEIPCARCRGSGSDGDMYCRDCQGDGVDWIDLAWLVALLHNIATAGAAAAAMESRDIAVQCATCALAEVA